MSINGGQDFMSALNNMMGGGFSMQGIFPPQENKALESKGGRKLNYTLVEVGTKLCLFVEMPGFDSNTISIDFYNNKVHVEGKKVKPYSVSASDTKLVKNTIYHGQHSADINLPVSVTNRDHVHIDYEHGLLKVEIDVEKELSNRFTINVGSVAN